MLVLCVADCTAWGKGSWGHFSVSFLLFFFFCSASEWQDTVKSWMALGRAQELGQVLLWLCVWVPGSEARNKGSLCAAGCPALGSAAPDTSLFLPLHPSSFLWCLRSPCSQGRV